MENWKDVLGYEGYYLVNNLGDIKSLGKGNNNRTKIGLLKNNKNPYGYLRVNLWKEGKYKTLLVHRIVGLAFLPNPDNKRTINHKNCNKEDNRLDNLEWATHSENHLHAFRNGRKNNPKYGADHHNSKAVLQLDLKGEIINTYPCQTQASKATGVNQSKISLVCLGMRKTSGGYKWRFA